MDHDFGKRLEQARIARGMSIEQASAAMRVRSTFLRSLEASDLTRFPNAAYAKSFLLMYARHLGVDVKAIAAEIDTTTQMKVEGYQYLTNRADELPRSRQEPEPSFSMAPNPGSTGSWLPLFVLGGVIVVVLAAFVFWSNVNRLPQTDPDEPKPAAARPADENAVRPAARTPAPPLQVKPAVATTDPPQQPDSEPPPPRPVVISIPSPVPAGTAPGGEPEIPRARPISPVGRIAGTDAATLADLGTPRPRPAPLIGATPPATGVQTPQLNEDNSLASDPNTIILEPRRKTWVVIRTSPGGQAIFEDYLYPTAKPMHLPAGRYFIELKEADAVEISRNGKPVAYSAPGIALQ